MAHHSLEIPTTDPPRQAEERARAVLAKIGTITETQPGAYVEGTVMYGYAGTRLRVSWRTQPPGTVLVVQAWGDDIWNAAAKSAVSRFTDAYRNLDNPGFVPDRKGVSSAMLAFSLVAAFIVILMILQSIYGR